MHNRKVEARVELRLIPEALGSLIVGGKVRAEFTAAVPVNDSAIQPAADHVIDLLLDLQRVTGNVADVHVVAKAEPGNQMRVNLGSGARIKQRSRGDLADV